MGDEFVKLKSSDGLEFVLEKKIAMLSNTIKNMLSCSGQFTESIQNEIFFREIRGVILEKVCQYLVYKNKYQNSTTEIPEFVIEPDIALELMMAADFLDT